MEKAFVDTGPLFEFGAAENRLLHEKSRELLLSSDYQWYSSSYVFDELMTLLVQRVAKSKLVAFGEKLRTSSKLIWLHPSLEEEEATWQVFKAYMDKGWSFTDCLSFHLIKKYSLTKVLSFDRHFTQMGFELL